MIEEKYYKYVIGSVVLITAFLCYEFVSNYVGMVEGFGAFGFLGLTLAVNYGVITKSKWTWKVIALFIVMLIINLFLIENDIRGRVLKFFIALLEMASHFK